MKRSGIERKTPMRPGTGFKPSEPKPAAGPRKRKCSNCGESFQQQRMGQQVCGTECASSFARRLREQQDRKKDRERKQAMKTRQQWLKEAQAVFNAYIRERDRDLPCISCGRSHGCAWDAGHYRSVGAMPSLRFDETNVHKQCVQCNQYRGGNILEYRLGLIARLGELAVAWLEMDHPPAKFTIEDAQNIKRTYQQKLKQMKESK